MKRILVMILKKNTTNDKFNFFCIKHLDSCHLQNSDKKTYDEQFNYRKSKGKMQYYEIFIQRKLDEKIDVRKA